MCRRMNEIECTEGAREVGVGRGGGRTRFEESKETNT